MYTGILITWLICNGLGQKCAYTEPEPFPGHLMQCAVWGQQHWIAQHGTEKPGYLVKKWRCTNDPRKKT